LNNSINNNNNTPSTHVASTPINTDAKDFIKGNKHDKTQYDVLKDECQFDNWYLSFLIMAHSHKIMDVLEATYVPSATDQEAFHEKVSFTFTVLHHALKMDLGVTLVKKHHETGDAQKLWTEFVTYMKKSTKVQILSANILSWIMTSKYDAEWRGPAQGFILYWLNKVLEYNSLYFDDDT
jgi:hypothetical protein